MISQSEDVVRIKFEGKQSEAFDYLKDPITKVVFYGGGAGGGKTWLGCCWKILQRINYPGTRGIIGRNELRTLKESTLITYFKVLNLMGYRNGIHYKFNASDVKFTFANGPDGGFDGGSEELFRQLKWEPSDPDMHNLGSTEYTDAFIDESPEITEKAFDIINSRLRWKISDYGLIPKCLITGNAGDHWVRDKFVYPDEPLPITYKFVQSTIDDNPDRDLANVYKGQLQEITNKYDRARLLEGDWDAIETTGTEFYFGYDNDNHKEWKFERDKSIHISFDQNYIPYNGALLAQMRKEGDIWHVNFFDEIALEPPNNGTKQVCQEFRLKYRPQDVDSIFYYGDSTSIKGNTLESGHDYDIIKRELNDYISPASNRIVTNKSRIKRRDFVNDILLFKNPRIRVWVDPKGCPLLRKDLLNCKIDADGGKLKNTVKDPKLGSYQKYGHFGDMMEYLLTSVFRDEFREYLKRHRW